MLTRTILNLACGTRTSDQCINIDWSIYCRIRRLPCARIVARLLCTRDQIKRYSGVVGETQVHDLRKGIPYGDRSVDAVYHSHLLEHLDRPAARQLLRESFRVLKPNGFHRIVVPDLSRLCRRYLEDFDGCQRDRAKADSHERFVEAMIEQMVRSEGAGTARQRWLRRAIENAVLGSATRRGEAHRWMYDEISLAMLLEQAGFRNVRTHTYRTSDIPGWNQIGLDTDDNGNEYKPNSCYVEAQR